MRTKMLMVILFLIVVVILYYTKHQVIYDNFSNYNLVNSTGDYPFASNSLLVQDSFPSSEDKLLSNNTSNDIWWHYPTFTLGSYSQITNNIQYPNNPDEGTCMPASMCQTLYKTIKNKSNYTYPLPPANYSPTGARVNYYNSDTNMLPYRISQQENRIES